MTRGRGRLEAAAAITLLAASAGLLIFEAWADSLTYDETRYMRAGYCALTSGVVDIEPTNPVGFKLLSGIGLLVARPGAAIDCRTTARTAFFVTDPESLRVLVLAGRLPLIAVALLLEAAIFIWARAIYGPGAGLLSLAVAGLEPTLLAHGHLATGDILVSAGTVACLLALWVHRRRGDRRWLVAAGLGLGCALLAKLSAVLVLPVVAAIVLFDTPPASRQPRRGAGEVMAVALVAWLTVCVVYLPFHTEHTPLHLGAPLAWLAPTSWLYGAWFQAGHVFGGTYGYLNGEVRIGRGFLTYYLEALALKSTAGFLALAALAALWARRRRDRVALLYFWLPAALLVAAASLNSIDIGVRYILPVYALLALAAGGLFAGDPPPWLRSGGLAAALLLGASSLVQFPHHVGYFNEAAGAHPERLLADSNLDWGQDAWRLRDAWMSAGRPRLNAAYFGGLPLQAYGIANRPLALASPPPADGAVAVSITQLVVYGQGADPHWRALLECLPGARVGRSTLWNGAVRVPDGVCPIVALR